MAECGPVKAVIGDRNPSGGPTKTRMPNMSSMSNIKKSEQLGMPYGTASGKLRKSIMHQLMQEAGRDICWQCATKIELVDDFSIEHKTPWLDNSPDLFWSLDNIAFSHLSCNSSAARQTRKIEYPDGQKWCSKCVSFRNMNEFPECAERSRRTLCRECDSKKRIGLRKKTGRR